MTHSLERIDLKMAEIQNTYQGKMKIPNPYADGHFKALSFAYHHLIDKDYFPAKDQGTLTDKSKSDAALFWLKDLNKTLLHPLTNHPVMLSQEDANVVLAHQIGKYRQNEMALSNRMAPHPSLIPSLLHLWLRDFAGVHHRLNKKAATAFSLSPQEAKELSNFAHHTLLFFSSVQPFQSANNRTGRLLENILRLQWRLPWKPLNKEEYEKFIAELENYQLKELPNLIAKAQSVK